MIFLAVAMIGAISLSKLRVSLLPDIEFPKITVLTSFKNASPSEIRDLVTRPLEESLSSVTGVKKIDSKSIEGLSIITLTFEWESDMDMALLNVSENTERMRTFLPQEIEKPIIIKFDPASVPVFILTVTSKNISENYLKIFIKKEIKTKLERIRGVGSVNMVGGKERIIDIEADLHALFSYNVGFNDLLSSIKASNYDFPAGNIQRGETEFLIRTIGRFKTIKEIEQVVIKTDEKTGVPVYLYNVAKVKDTIRETQSLAMVNGEETIALELKKEAGTNVVAVCSRIKEAIQELIEKYSDRIDIHIIKDESLFIQNSVGQVYHDAILGGILAFLILLFFLKEIKLALIIVLSIPISILATFIFMYMAGLSINMMSLGGLAIGIGMIVDDSIIVLENINRYKEKGYLAVKACVIGTAAVQISVFGSTLTSIIVFLPLIFLKGLVGALFKEMAFTITFALLSSIIVANFLVPMLASFEWSTKHIDKENKLIKTLKNFSGNSYASLENKFVYLFERFFKLRKLIILSAIVLLIFAFFGFTRLDSELMPHVQDRSLNIWVKMPEGTTIEATQNVVTKLNRRLKEFKYIEKIFSTIGFEDENLVAKIDDKVGRHMANLIVFLKEGMHSEQAYNELSRDLNFQADKAQVVISQPADIVTRIVSEETKPIIINIEGKNTDKLVDVAKEMLIELKKISGITHHTLSISEGKLEIKVRVDRDKLASFGLNVEGVSKILKIALDGEKISKYNEGDHNIDIRVRLQKEDRNSVAALEKTLIPNIQGVHVPLIKIAHLQMGIGTDKILRENQADLVQVKADFDKSVFTSYGKAKVPVENAVLQMKHKLKSSDIYDISVTGENERLSETFSQLGFMFMLSIVFIYMLIASLFESLAGPLILMLSIPMGIIGVVPALLVSGLSLNIMSGMGLIMLGGVTIKSGIILLEFIKQDEAQGKDIKSAIYEAVKIRLRPIIMNVLITILCLTPLALAIGSGAEIQQPLAVAMIGGLIVSTLLILLVIPGLYFMYKSFFKKH